jgi:hypothetical protein
MKKLGKLGLLCLLAGFLGVAPLAFADDHWSDDWKISVDGKSDSGGKISFKLTFEPDEDEAPRDAVTVDVLIPEGTGEDDMADMISNSFRAVLGDDDFDIDTSWGEHIKVEASGDTPDFVIEIAGNSVEGVDVEIDD